MPSLEPTIARVAAHGRTRAEAVARLHGAAAGAAVLVRGAGTNRASSSTWLPIPTCGPDGSTSGGSTGSWPAAGDRVAQEPEVALCQAAILAYELGESYDRSRFLAAGRRGVARWWAWASVTTWSSATRASPTSCVSCVEDRPPIGSRPTA